MNTLYTLVLFLLLSPALSSAQEKQYSPEQYKQDFNYFWTSINDEYCYFNKKQTDWDKVKDLYSRLIDTVQSRGAFVAVLEKALYELYDHHCNFNTNTDFSRRLVPTSTDVWADYFNGKPVITEVRKNSGAEACGVRAGMEVISINNVPVETAVQTFMPQSLKQPDPEAKNFSLRLLLAGNHIQPRKFTLKYEDKVSDYFPDQSGMQLEHITYVNKIDTKMYGDVGYIRINNCLFDNALVSAFDSVMHTLSKSKALLVDLRETPSGGNSSVARAILGWFINQDHFYQKHEYYAEEKMYGIKRSWEEIASPRKNKYYGKPLVILVNHWTGSIAEGITIGFDAFHRPHTKIIGTTMARLNGAVYSYEMPNTKIKFSFTAERLYHVNNLPREQYVPQVLIDLVNIKPVAGTDIFISAALNYLKRI
ncbi:MAG: peptidase [Sphingobacteriales bacterium]|nr:peptidase [Sphingobacteriales bacterium]